MGHHRRPGPAGPRHVLHHLPHHHGPRAQDRILGLDTLYVNAMLMLVTFGIRTGSTLYFEAALVIGLLGFVWTVALAKFLMRGEVIE